MYKDKAYEIAGKLLPAFNTPSGIPMAQVNLQTGESECVSDACGFRLWFGPCIHRFTYGIAV